MQIYDMCLNTQFKYIDEGMYMDQGKDLTQPQALISLEVVS